MSMSTNAILEHFANEPLRTFKRQRTVLYQGEVPKSVYVIKHGVIRSYNISETGEERTIELLTEGDVLPLSWAYDNSNVVLYYYDAFSDVQVYAMTKERYLEITRDPGFANELIRTHARRYSAATMHINALQQTHASKKVAHGLLYLALSRGKKLPNGRYNVHIRLTQQDLANIVGLTRETTAIELNRLKEKKIISYKSFKYTIDYDALIRLSGGDEFDGLKLQ